MLAWVVQRAARARLVDEVVVATTTRPRDDAIAALALVEGWCVTRGSEDDVLDRYHNAAEEYRGEVVVRITADCPLIDPTVVDLVVARLTSAVPTYDYASNTLNRTFPRGLDVEAIRFETIDTAWREATSATDREHVTPYIYNRPERFSLLSVENPTNHAAHRWTVDTPEDLQLVRLIFEDFGHGDFDWQSVMTLLERRPDLSTINQHVMQVIP
jgi:spore coat polysaccharide biosynthesis protein SpsF